MTPLVRNIKLDHAAQKKAKALAACSCFQHELPDGRTPWDFIKAERLNYREAGENLAVDFISVENMNTAWMESPGHRANVLNHFTQTGIGIAPGMWQGHQTLFVVQLFIRK